MGQSASTHSLAPQSHEEAVKTLANKFAEKCFSSIELYSLKDNFRSLADSEHDVRYLKEDTIARFLEIPDVLQASSVLFQMISFLGAFPFLQDAPAFLGLEQTVMIVSILTERYQRILVKGATDRRKLLFRSLAVFDRNLAEVVEKTTDAEPASLAREKQDTTYVPGFAVDNAGDEEADDAVEDEDDALVLTVLESLDYLDVFKADGHSHTHGAIIPTDNFRKLVMLLLFIAPMSTEDRLSQYIDHISGDELEKLRRTADCVVSAFLDIETAPGIKFGSFSRIVPASLPHLFNGFNVLFERFLFAKKFDSSKTVQVTETKLADSLPTLPGPLLPEPGTILTQHIVSQLSFFIPGTSLFHRLRPLYSGEKDGFSMGSFESKVFNWRAPTILLVSGTHLEADSTRGGSEDRFSSSLPPKRFRNGSKAGHVTYGVYISHLWKHTNRECFGDSETILFQIQPTHDVMLASTLNKDYVCFTKPSATATTGSGISVGSPPPRSGAAYRHDTLVSLGPVSLFLDSSFEYGVFTHDFESRGGAFASSVSRQYSFQDRFEIEGLEVWGCGGDEEAKIQAERWAFEAREAEARRRINLGTGDIEADRALLEMAGLIGANRSGGSIN